jgi:Domain of unknown function (DUF4333)
LSHPLTAAIVTAAVALAVTGLLGCSLEKEVDTAAAESEIEKALAERTGAPIDAVKCPAEVEVKKGDVFHCRATAGDGSRIPISVTQIDGDGGVRWRIGR